jgi:hypothetical protein
MRSPAWTGRTLVGTNAFLFFDASNLMYRGFVYAEDAIKGVVRGRRPSHLKPQSVARLDSHS